MTAVDERYQEAIQTLRRLFAEARGAEPGAATLATTGVSGRPSVRTVTVVAIEDAGPVFYLRRASAKGRQLAEDPRAALCFFWPEQQYQVIVEGEVQTLADAEAERLWQRRPRKAQLAGWIGEFDPPAGQPDTVETRIAEAHSHFAWERVPCPPGWSALCLQPSEIDSWQLVWDKPRLREHFHRDADGRWHKELLAPF